MLDTLSLHHSNVSFGPHEPSVYFGDHLQVLFQNEKSIIYHQTYNKKLDRRVKVWQGYIHSDMMALWRMS